MGDNDVLVSIKLALRVARQGRKKWTGISTKSSFCCKRSTSCTQTLENKKKFWFCVTRLPMNRILELTGRLEVSTRLESNIRLTGTLFLRAVAIQVTECQQIRSFHWVERWPSLDPIWRSEFLLEGTYLFQLLLISCSINNFYWQLSKKRENSFSNLYSSIPPSPLKLGNFIMPTSDSSTSSIRIRKMPSWKKEKKLLWWTRLFFGIVNYGQYLPVITGCHQKPWKRQNSSWIT
jgi:hypothetical protein